MSINNSRAITHISTNNSIFRLADTDVKRKVSEVEEKKHTSRKSREGVESVQRGKDQPTKNFYSSAAEELVNKVSNRYKELAVLTQVRLNPIAFAKINTAPSSSFNNVDLKRHQNYFNSMMNYNNPAGSWVNLMA